MQVEYRVSEWIYDLEMYMGSNCAMISIKIRTIILNVSGK